MIKSKTSTETEVYNYYGCDLVQARITRYYSGIVNYYGPQVLDVSYVRATNGTDAGHAGRSNQNGWNAWQSF